MRGRVGEPWLNDALGRHPTAAPSFVASATIEMPDVETSSWRYAQRFRGDAGAYLLAVQAAGVRKLIARSPKTRPQTALDVGGGHAQLADTLLATGAAVTVLGSDDRCAAYLRQTPRWDAVAYRSGALLALPYAERSIDLVTSIRLIPHMTDWRGLIGELCRVAKGSVIVDYPTYVGSNALALAAFPIKRLIEKDTRTYRSFWPGTIDRAFRDHGFHRVATYKQFTLPMGLHRLLGRAIRPAEEALRTIGVTRLAGNPVLVRYDRSGAA
jgi:ubiquinone/menaquinone biosynthesis C-methylase UbiE